MAHPYVLWQESLPCLQAQSQDYGANTRKRVTTQAELWKGNNPAARPVSAPLCRRQHCQSPMKLHPACYSCAFFWPNCQNQTPWGCHEGSTSSSRICAHSPALCSSICICQRTPELAVSPLVPCSLQTWMKVHYLHVTDMKESGDAVANIMLPATSSSMTGLAVGQWWSGKAYPWRVAQTSTC